MNFSYIVSYLRNKRGFIMDMNELLKYAESKDFYTILCDWRDSGLMMKILPEVAVMDEFIHNPQYHPEGCTEDSYGTALDHVLECVKIADELNYTPEEKICVLFHDIGKCGTASNYSVDRPYHNFYGHENYGVKVLSCLSIRMNIDDALKEKLEFCIRYHMHLYKIQQMRTFKVQKLVNHKFWPLIKKVCLCDDASRGLAFREEEYYNNVSYAEHYITIC